MIDLKPNKKLLRILLTSYLLIAMFLSINPFDKTTWFVENLTVWILIGVITFLYFKKIRFTNLAYILMFAFLILHTIGGHYTFADVPFDFVTNLFGFSRNHFDRLAHFMVGVFAYPIAEWILAKNNIKNRFVLVTYPIFAIMSAAVTYELIEWIYAAKSAPELGLAYLGSQGDIWDAQKDMLMDTLGAISITSIFYIKYRNIINKIDT